MSTRATVQTLGALATALALAAAPARGQGATDT